MVTLHMDIVIWISQDLSLKFKFLRQRLHESHPPPSGHMGDLMQPRMCNFALRNIQSRVKSFREWVIGILCNFVREAQDRGSGTFRR